MIRENRIIPEELRGCRSVFQVDRDRIHYASAFARLAEVTQVVSADNGYVFHNRLTHSLKVAQLARRLAEKLNTEQRALADSLGGLDPDAAEAAALAHDLGHPPFGHLAEEALNDLCLEFGLLDGYEGNAQSFRIVTKLAVGDAIDESGEFIEGLNLTRATLNGILKYPWLKNGNPDKPKKWGAYNTEEEQFNFARSEQPFGRNVKSIEAELMDWADDITFSVHDLTDFYCAGQIPLEQLRTEPEDEEIGGYERTAFFDEVFSRCEDLANRRNELESTFSRVMSLFPLKRRYTGAREQRYALWQFNTVLISQYVDAIKLQPLEVDGRCVAIDPQALDEIRMLKELTWHYVILQNDLAAGQHGQRRMIEWVFRELHSVAQQNKSWKLFPPFFEERIREAAGDSNALTRVVADYVSSMTETEVARTYSLLGGGGCQRVCSQPCA